MYLWNEKKRTHINDYLMQFVWKANFFTGWSGLWMGEDWEPLWGRVFMELPSGLPGNGGERQSECIGWGSKITPLLPPEQLCLVGLRSRLQSKSPREEGDHCQNLI